MRRAIAIYFLEWFFDLIHPTCSLETLQAFKELLACIQRDEKFQ